MCFLGLIFPGFPVANRICLKTPLLALPAHSPWESEFPIWWYVCLPTAGGVDTPCSPWGVFPQEGEPTKCVNHRKRKCFHYQKQHKTWRERETFGFWDCKRWSREHLLPSKEYIMEDTILSKWISPKSMQQNPRKLWMWGHRAGSNSVSILTFKQRNVAAWGRTSWL